MPEGHTLHRLANQLARCFAGDVVHATSPQGRFANGAALLDGTALESTASWGKHLFCHFQGDHILHVHLGLYGTFVTMLAPGAAPHGAVRLRLTGPRAVGDLRAPTVCEVLAPAQRDVLLARLGSDPLRDDADGERAWSAVRGSRRSVASLLMDQSVVSGVGNVYRAEVLYRHRLDPATPGRQVSRGVWQDLWDDLVELMHRGVLAGHIDTVRLHHLPPGGEGPPHVYVYRRAGEPCLVCGTRVRTTVIEGRNLYWCPTCQRRRGGRRLVNWREGDSGSERRVTAPPS